ncbi:MAG: hypothetical protein OD816_001469 [Thermodesulfobacterium sp.]|uniref:Septum formation initiator family protein n=1 Tax=Candidatus Thermodesulfobacterium syntrophicum TaxID=3060442 RepID=A0AAE3TG64_9BACT|nr:hypothetical protein [Candidatus Thermodesulfobacterium syntrophicum]
MVLGEAMGVRYQPQIVIKPKRKKRRKRKKWFLAILLIAVFLTFSIYLGLSFMVKREMSKIEEIEKENRYLREKIQKFSTSDIPYEELLRTKYGYIKRGEKIIIYSPYYYKTYYYKNSKIKEGVEE